MELSEAIKIFDTSWQVRSGLLTGVMNDKAIDTLIQNSEEMNDEDKNLFYRHDRKWKASLVCPQRPHTNYILRFENRIFHFIYIPECIGFSLGNVYYGYEIFEKEYFKKKQ